MAVSFTGGGNQNTQRKPLTCRKSLTNFITFNYFETLFEWNLCPIKINTGETEIHMFQNKNYQILYLFWPLLTVITEVAVNPYFFDNYSVYSSDFIINKYFYNFHKTIQVFVAYITGTCFIQKMYAPLLYPSYELDKTIQRTSHGLFFSHWGSRLCFHCFQTVKHCLGSPNFKFLHVCFLLPNPVFVIKRWHYITFH